MSSIHAEQVVKEVITKVRNGEKVNMQKIQMKHGYSPKSARSMKVKETETFKKGIKPLTDQLKDEIDKIAIEMRGRDVSKERYKDLAEVQDKLIRNYQLLNDKPTDITKNNIDEFRAEIKDLIKTMKDDP